MGRHGPARIRSRAEAIMHKELIQIARDPRSLGVALQLPVVMLILYGYGVSGDVRDIRMAVVDWSRTAASRDLVGAFTRSGYFTAAYRTDRYADACAELDGRRVKMVLVIPADFARRMAGGRAVAVQCLLDGSDPTTAGVAGGYVESVARTWSSARIVTRLRKAGMGFRAQGIPPLDLRTRVWYNEELRNMNYIVPGLIAVIMMMTSALLTSGTISRERERGTIEQLIASPLRPWELMLGKIAAYALVACLDVVIVVALGRAWFGVPLRGSLWLLAGGSALFLMSSLGLGLLISSAIPSQQAAMVAAIMVTMVPSILLSGFYFPIGSMPPVVQAFTTIVPARYFLALVRGVFLKGSGMAELWPNLAALGCMGLLLMTASIRAFKKRL